MKKQVLTYILCGFVALSSFAQSKNMRRGNEAFNDKTFATARVYYEKVFDNARAKGDNETAAYASFQIAECYYKANNYERAIPFYNHAISLNYNDTSKTLYRNYGDMLMMEGDYQKAKEMYKKHMDLYGIDEITYAHLKSCEFVDTAQTYETMYEVSNAQAINSRCSDFAPAPYRNKIVFTTSRFSRDSVVYTYTGDSFEDLFETYYNIEEDTWSPVSKLPGSINSSYNDGSFTFDARNQIAYFMQCNGATGADKNCNIYFSKFNSETNEWAKPKAFQYFNTRYSSGHPALTPDGLTLYFVSNNPAGLGGTDIWRCHRDSTGTNLWSNPENLGPTINTKDNEMFPYVNDNNGLYFSSNGHIGYGGLDIYYAAKNGTSFSTPINLRPPFNSSADDFSLMYLNEKQGLFSSNRIGGVGNDDIYMFRLKDVKLEVMGRVLDANGSKPVENAIVLIKNVENGTTDTLVTDSVGRYFYPAMEPDMQYKIFVYKNGFLNPDGKLINTQGVTQYTYLDSLHGYDMNFTLQKIEKGKEYEIRDIYYDLDKYELRPVSITELQNLVTILNNNPDICIQINSHTDERASDAYNKILSNNRAKAVVDYLTSQGINDKRLTWKGWGESNPIYKNAKTEEQHQSNRRTTFTIMNFDELQLAQKEEEHNSMISRLESNGKQAPHEQGVYFRLQIGASKAKCNNKTFKKLEESTLSYPTYCSKDSDGMYKYMIGSFSSFQDATKAKDDIDNIGYNSFVVAFENGNKISINEALRKIQQTKK